MLNGFFVYNSKAFVFMESDAVDAFLDRFDDLVAVDKRPAVVSGACALNEGEAVGGFLVGSFVCG